MEQVINDLKVRSGKSPSKYIVDDIIEENFEDNVISVVFLASETARIALVLQKNDVQSYKIEKNKTFFVQNLEHVQTDNEVAFFKIPSPAKIILKSSRTSVPNSLKFEKKHKKTTSLDMKKIFGENVPAPEVKTENELYVLSLFDFIQNATRQITGMHYVEVNILFILNFSSLF